MSLLKLPHESTHNANWPRSSLGPVSTRTVEELNLLFSATLSSHFCCCLVTKLCLSLCDPMDCSLPGSSVHGLSQARILEWVAISYSRGSSALVGRFFTTELPEKPWLANDCLIIVSSPGRGRESKLWCFFLKEHESYHKRFILISSVQFSRSVVSNSLRPHESQHAMPPCPSPTPGVHSDSGPSSQ